MTDSNTPSLQFFDAPNPHGAGGTHKLAFYEWGSPYAPPVLCVHGLTRNGRDFDFLARKLTEHYRVIAIDMPGRGKSESLRDIRWYENGTYMQDALALAERMNLGKFDWIGTSMGGIIGMMIASLVPGKITRLVLNDVGALLPKEGLMRIGDYVGKKQHFSGMDEAIPYVQRIMAPFGVKEDAHWAHVFEHSFIRHADGQVSFAYDPGIGDAFRLAASEIEKLEDISLWMLWESIDCPTLILRGAESDILTREVAEKMCEMHENATLAEFPGIGHAPTLLEDGQIKVVADWLEAHPLKGC